MKHRLLGFVPFIFIFSMLVSCSVFKPKPGPPVPAPVKYGVAPAPLMHSPWTTNQLANKAIGTNVTHWASTNQMPITWVDGTGAMFPNHNQWSWNGSRWYFDGPIKFNGPLDLDTGISLGSGYTIDGDLSGGSNSLFTSQIPYWDANHQPVALNVGSGLSLNTSTHTLTSTGSGGTVTSVGLSVPSPLFGITPSSSPVTSSGTLLFTNTFQSARTFFAGPVSGGDVAPTMRLLSATDLALSPATDQFLQFDGANLVWADLMQVISNFNQLVISNLYVTSNFNQTLSVSGKSTFNYAIYTNGFGFITNSWPNSPTGAVSVALSDPYDINAVSATACQISGITGKSNNITSTKRLSFYNTSSTNWNLTLANGIQDASGQSSLTVSNGGHIVVFLEYTPQGSGSTVGATNAYTFWYPGFSSAPGTFRSVTVDNQGRVTAGTAPTTFSGYSILDSSANFFAALTDFNGGTWSNILTKNIVAPTNALPNSTVVDFSLRSATTNMSGNITWSTFSNSNDTNYDWCIRHVVNTSGGDLTVSGGTGWRLDIGAGNSYTVTNLTCRDFWIERQSGQFTNMFSVNAY